MSMNSYLPHTAAWRQMFGSMIEERREAIHRSLDEAARLSGMEVSEWAAIEAGHVPADPARLRAMAAALEVRFDEMALRFAAALDVPVQELLQTDTPPEIVQQRKPSRKVLERLEKIQSLPRRKQDAILTTIDHFLNSAVG